MDIMELGAIGELVGGVAVLATLIYLATQLRQLKQQNLLVSYQHTYDSVNAFCDVVSSSDELAPSLFGAANRLPPSRRKKIFASSTFTGDC